MHFSRAKCEPCLLRYTFRSGNAEHPSDKLYNTTVEVLPVRPPSNYDIYNTTSDGYVIVGKQN